MTPISERVRDYLDRKRPKVTPDVTPTSPPEVEPDELLRAWSEFKDHFKGLRLAMLIFSVIFSVGLLAWVYSIVELQNKCYLDKECREWVEKRR